MGEDIKAMKQIASRETLPDLIIPDKEIVKGEAFIDELYIIKGNAVDPWSKRGEPILKDKNYKMIITNEKLYLIGYDYSVELKTLKKRREKENSNAYKDIVEYRGYATISRNIYVIPLSLIEKISASLSNGISRNFSIEIFNRTKRSIARIALSIFMLVTSAIMIKIGFEAAGIAILLLSLIILAHSLSYRKRIQEAPRITSEEGFSSASMAILKLLVRDQTPRKAKTTRDHNNTIDEIEYDIEYYTILLLSYNEDSTKLIRLSRFLL
ncbi:MAG: hypothetical protein DSY37_03455 [Hyperthermus sp.]|nr:MAG: hypothetical protein DSY37_03455 [Hyperthermus sp.]